MQGNERLVGRHIGELARAAERQRLAQRTLEMTVRGLDRAVLMADAGVVAGRLDPVMVAEGLIARRGVIVRRQVAIGGRQPVGAVGRGSGAELPERLLHALGQRGEALAAFDRLDVLPAREGQPEVEQQMIERHAGDRHLERGGVGEVAQRLKTRRMVLAEDDLAFWTFGRPPVRDTALERAQVALVQPAWMIAADLLDHRRGAQMRNLVQHRKDDLVPHARQRVGARSASRLALARKPVRRRDAPRAAFAEPGLRRRDSLPVA